MVSRMWKMQGLIFFLLSAAATARQLDATAPDTITTPNDETTTQGLSENDLIHDGTTEKPDGNQVAEDEDDEDLGELVFNEIEDLEEFDEHLIDVSDMPIIDGRTCFTAWENLKLVDPETQIVMTLNPKTNPMKALNSKAEDLFPGFPPENFKTVKTPCYRSLHPESDNQHGDAGYCNSIRYTTWKSQRFCCPQGVVHPLLTSNGNMFKCACVYDAYTTSKE